jgi:hypothetical protein
MHAETALPTSSRFVCALTSLKMRLRGGEWKKEQGKGWVWVGDAETKESQPQSNINQKSNRRMRRKAAKEKFPGMDTENQPPSNKSQGWDRAHLSRNHSQAESNHQSSNGSVQSVVHEAASEAKPISPVLPLAKTQEAKRAWLPPADLDLPIPLPPSMQRPKAAPNRGSDNADQNVVSALKKLLEVA